MTNAKKSIENIYADLLGVKFEYTVNGYIVATSGRSGVEYLASLEANGVNRSYIAGLAKTLRAKARRAKALV